MNSIRPHTPRKSIGLAALGLGAASVLAIGADHIQQYFVDNYRVVPTIGTLFLLNFISSMVVGVVLLAPLHRLIGRYADAVRSLFALGGIGIAAGSLAGLFIAESSGLFGFREYNYRPVIVVAIAFEVAAIAFLSVYLVTLRRARHGRGPAAG